MSLTLNSQARNAFMDTTGNTVFNSGKLCIYSGSRPATANLAPVGTLLAEIAFGSDAFGAASAGTITLAGTPISDSSANGSGTASWFRIKAASDDDSLNGAFARIDGDCSTSGSDLNLDNLSIASGQVVTLSSFTLTLPAS